MKKMFSILLCLSFGLGYVSAQVPQAFKYQAIVRNPNNNDLVFANHAVSLRISILQGSASGPVAYSETFSVTTNEFGLVNLEIGNGTPLFGSFSTINWTTGSFYLKTQVDSAGGTTYRTMGTIQLLSVPYAIYSDKTNKSDKLEVMPNSSLSSDSALFLVKDKLGRPVFAVYEDGAIVYVNEGAKGGRGGFAVGGRKPGKGFVIDDIMRVTKDSVRIYINDTAIHKGGRGGFAVGGRSQKKQNAIDYFNISGSKVAEVINPSQPRILWYPRKEAILTGRVLVEDPDSVGTNAMATGYESKAIGNWSQAFGYKTIARKDYSTAIGKNAVATGFSSFALGEGAKAFGNNSYAMGAFAEARGAGSFAFGYTGRDSIGPSENNTVASGDNSFAFGLGAKASGLGSFAFGTENEASGEFSTALGYKTKAKDWYSFSIGTQSVASGFGSIAMGYATESSGFTSISLGGKTVASGGTSLAGGWGSVASGDGSFAWGFMAKASNANSLAVGNYAMAGGTNSLAFGDSVKASGMNSLAFGFHTQSSGWNSLALGAHSVATGSTSIAGGYTSSAIADGAIALGDHSIARGLLSTTFGGSTTAAGDYSAAWGIGNNAKSYTSFVIGQYNDTTSSSGTSWVSTDPLMVVGNGSSNSARSNAFTVLKNGNVGISNASPGARLDITGGNARVQSGYNWLTNSDARHKKNITTLDQALDKVLSLRAVRYDLARGPESPTGKGKYIGFIAQELEKEFPEFVVTGEDGYKAVAYDKMTAVLVEAIKEQQQQITAQQQENQELKQLLQSLQSQVNEMKELVGKSSQGE